MITYIANFFQSLAIAVECNDLARSGDWEQIKEIINSNHTSTEETVEVYGNTEIA